MSSRLGLRLARTILPCVCRSLHRPHSDESLSGQPQYPCLQSGGDDSSLWDVWQGPVLLQPRVTQTRHLLMLRSQRAEQGMGTAGKCHLRSVRCRPRKWGQLESELAGQHPWLARGKKAVYSAIQNRKQQWRGGGSSRSSTSMEKPTCGHVPHHHSKAESSGLDFVRRE